MAASVLPHTGLIASRPCPVITDLKTLDLSFGQALRADVRFSDGPAGWFENAGTGGETVFWPASASARRRMERFVTTCLHPWLPVSPSMVYTLLVEEHDHAQFVADACRHGGTAARFLLGGQPVGVFAEIGLSPQRWADMAADMDLLHALEPVHDGTGAWQLWDGDRWREVCPEPSPCSAAPPTVTCGTL